MKLYEEFKEYENLWNNTLLEWRAINTVNTTAVVYAWDLYIDQKDKGTFCSVEKHKGQWTGTVYKTREQAEEAGWDHLLELEDEGELEVGIEPSDYTVDVFTIPLEDIPLEVLKFSGLEDLLEQQNIKEELNNPINKNFLFSFTIITPSDNADYRTEWVTATNKEEALKLLLQKYKNRKLRDPRLVRTEDIN